MRCYRPWEIAERFGEGPRRDPESEQAPAPEQPRRPSVKLTRREVRQMRKLRAEGWTLREIGDRFGVSRSRVCVLTKSVRRTPRGA